MPKRFYLDNWKVPPPNPSPDEQRAAQLRRLREQIPPQVPPVPSKRGEERRNAAGAPQQSQVVARGLDALMRTQREEGKMRRILLSHPHYTPQEDSDLSLYDDLGVPRTATPEEIRQAHRALARLLHPDRITDEYTRRVAENTLKRVNAAFAVLNDPAHREAYDRELGLAGGILLAAARRTKAPLLAALQDWLAKRTNPAWLRRNLLWIGATLTGLALIYWVLGSDPPSTRTTAVAQLKPAPVKRLPEPRAASMPPPQLKPQPETPPHKAAAPAQIEAPRPPVRHAALIAPPEIHRAEPELLPPPPDFSAQAAPALPAAAKPTLDGLWVYLKPAQAPRSPNTYPPEFIELTLHETNGILRGRYSARYQVADRPISPEVRFQFEGGAASSSPATFNWTGNGGSRGEVRLNKVGDQQLQVLWFTTQPGPEIGLRSGSATLIRRQAP